MPIETVDLVSSQAVTEREEMDTLPEIFWENTKLRPRAGIAAAVRRIQLFLSDTRKVASARQSYKTYATVPRLALPDPQRPRAPFPPFDQVVLGRRSAILSTTGPVFSPDPVPLERLGDLLYFTYGVVRPPLAKGAAGEPRKTGLLRRVAPSGGALYPLELYVVAVKVEGIAPGVYHYNAYDHRLEQLRALEVDDAQARLDGMLAAGLNYEGVALMLVITATPLRSTFKYGDRGFRLLLVEAGHAAQNAYLAGTALGLSACAVAGFYDDEVNRVLGINGLDEISTYVLLAGMPLEGSATPAGDAP
jgi:SagB-type dehydrogenase family enzyme